MADSEKLTDSQILDELAEFIEINCGVDWGFADPNEEFEVLLEFIHFHRSLQGEED
jgi:hypothetical protein|tara:strand:+ start:296 stop:463 length:168 start_codon:yes stop_codon:yes gene_type:complete